MPHPALERRGGGVGDGDHAAAVFEYAQATLDQSRTDLKNSKIVAPIDGVVLRKLVEESELVPPGQPVVVLGGAGGSLRGGRVLDPFAGSGTTLVQALESGLDATGVDIAAFNCLLMDVKTRRYNLFGLEHDLRDVLGRYARGEGTAEIGRAHV